MNIAALLLLLGITPPPEFPPPPPAPKPQPVAEMPRLQNPALQPLLEQAEGLLRGNFAAGATPGLDDIVLFPPLRNLSCVKDLVYPPRLGAYVERLASLGRIDLYRDRAC